MTTERLSSIDWLGHIHKQHRGPVYLALTTLMRYHASFEEILRTDAPPSSVVLDPEDGRARVVVYRVRLPRARHAPGCVQPFDPCRRPGDGPSPGTGMHASGGLDARTIAVRRRGAAILARCGLGSDS